MKTMGICRRVRRRRSERGSALLIVFVFAAVVAISLYMEMPVAAFEAQRLREQLLINRGEEYARAVQVFHRKLGRYPASFKDLENTNNMRFLRSEYPDPFTGKADWRLLHAGPNGMLIDSKVPANQQLGLPGQAGVQNSGQNGASSSSLSASNGSTSGNSGFASSNSTFGGSSSFGSSTGTSGGSSGGNNGTGAGSSNGGFESPFSSSSSNAPPEVMVQQPRRRGPEINANGGPTLASTDSEANDDGSLPPLPNPDVKVASSSGAQNVAANGTDQASASSNAASALGNGGLKSAMLGGSAGSILSGSGSSQMGVINSGGLAGVASKAGGTSIKEINEQSDYSLWEFYYDPRKETVPGGVKMGQYSQQQQQQAGTANGIGFGSGAGNSTGSGSNSGFGASGGQSSFGSGSSSFGSTSSFGNSSSFGSSSTGSAFGNNTSTNSNQNQPPAPTNNSQNSSPQ